MTAVEVGGRRLVRLLVEGRNGRFITWTLTLCVPVVRHTVLSTAVGLVDDLLVLLPVGRLEVQVPARVPSLPVEYDISDAVRMLDTWTAGGYGRVSGPDIRCTEVRGDHAAIRWQVSLADRAAVFAFDRLTEAEAAAQLPPQLEGWFAQFKPWFDFRTRIAAAERTALILFRHHRSRAWRAGPQAPGT